jgi:hypothetical protein
MGLLRIFLNVKWPEVRYLLGLLRREKRIREQYQSYDREHGADRNQLLHVSFPN